MTPEGLVRNLVCGYLRAKNLLFFIHDSVGIYDPRKKIYRKNKSPYRINGVSDIIGMLPDGRMFAIELKAGTNKPTQDQLNFIENVNNCGGVAFWAKSIDDVKREFEARGVVL